MNSEPRARSPVQRAQRLVWWNTLEFLLLFAVLTVWLHVALVSKYLSPTLLSLGVSFLITQVGLVGVIMIKVFVGKGFRLLTTSRARDALPALRSDLASYVSGREGPRKVEHWHATMGADFEACLVDFLPVLVGRRREKLVALAGALGLVQKWRKQYDTAGVTRRLDAITKLGMVAGEAARTELRRGLLDPHEGLRIEAAKGLMRVGAAEDVARVMEFALTDGLLVRAVLADDLKPHAELLSRELLPQFGLHCDLQALRNGLEMLRSWRVYVAFPSIGALLHHQEPEIVALSLQVLPFVVERDRFGSEVLAGLVARSARVRESAAFCAGRLCLKSAADVLMARIEDRDAGVAQAAATALARLGDEGMDRLDAALVGAGQHGARVALETLEQVRVGRLHAAGG